MKDFNKNQRVEAGLPAEASAEEGQTLLEILLAFSVSILVLSAIIIGITTSLSNAQYTKNQNLANSYAKEAIAVVRQIRDSSWTNFFSKTGVNYCLAQNSVFLTDPSCRQNVGIFSREVKLEHESPNCCPDNTQTCANNVRGSQATVKVSWSDSKCPIGTPYCHKVELITCFSKIDQRQTP